ncbi:hypothetical protein ACWDFL_24565 [Streptomyces bungoensis]
MENRHRRAMACKEHAADGVSVTREYVEAALGLEVWAHHLYRQAMAAPHEGAGGRGHGIG